MFLSYPYFSRFFRFSDVFPDASDRHKIVPLPVLLISAFFPFFQMRPIATKLFPFLFFSFPHFSGFCRFWPDASPFLFFSIIPEFSGFCRFLPLRLPPNCSPSRSSHFRIFVGSSAFPTFFRMRPTATNLFPFLFLSFPNFPGYFRIFPTCSGCVRPPQNCSTSCSSHFRILQILPDFSDFFRLVPDASDHHATKLFPFLLLAFPDFSGFLRLFRHVPDASRRHKGSQQFALLAFPDFPDFFTTCSGCVRPPQNCCPSCLSHFRILQILPDFSDFFRLVPDASDHHATKLFPFLLLAFPDFSGFLRLFRHVPDASRRHKIDRAPCC